MEEEKKESFGVNKRFQEMLSTGKGVSSKKKDVGFFSAIYIVLKKLIGGVLYFVVPVAIYTIIVAILTVLWKYTVYIFSLTSNLF